MGLENVIREGKEFINSNRGFVASGAFMLSGALLDSITTHYFLESGGDLASEINPLIRYAIENYGIASVYLLKIGVPAIAIGVSRIMSAARYVNIWGGALYAGAAVGNILQILKMHD